MPTDSPIPLPEAGPELDALVAELLEAVKPFIQGQPREDVGYVQIPVTRPQYMRFLAAVDATPLERCRAALRAVEGKEPTP